MFQQVTVQRKSGFHIQTGFFLALALLILLPSTNRLIASTRTSPPDAHFCLDCQSGTLESTPATTVLEIGKAIARELAGAQKHVYQITLSANQYTKVIIEQRGLDVLARLTGDDGKPLAEYDAEMRPNGTENVEFVATAGGRYLLEIEPRYKLLPGGKYEIRLAEMREATKAEKSLQEARNLYAESLRLYNAGKYDKAQPLIERAIDLRQKELGLEHPAVAAAFTHLARIYDAQGNYNKAEDIHQQVLLIREKILGPNHPDVAYTLNYLATNYSHKGEYQKAILFHQRALAIREKAFGPNHPIVAVGLINLGLVYDSLGDKLKVEELYQRALKIQEQTAGPENLNTAVVLNNLGKIYNDLDEYKKAELFLQRAVAILEKLVGPDHPRIFDALTNLAYCYLGERAYDKAESLYQRILQAREKTVGSDHPLTAHAANNLASLYAFKGELDKSELLYQRALKIRENTLGPDHPEVSETLSGLALLLALKGDATQAVKLQERAAAIDERNTSLNLAIGSEREKLAYITNLFDQTNQTLFLNARFAPDNPAAANLAATTVLRQKGRVLDTVANHLTELRRRSNAEDRALLDQLNDITAQLAGLVLGGPENTTLAEHQAKIKRLTDEREKLEDEISHRAAGFFASSRPVTINAIQTAMPRDAALIEFAVYYPVTLNATTNYNKPYGEPHYVVYVIPSQGEARWKELGEAREIDGTVAVFRRALRDPQRRDVRQLGRAVDEKIMRPVRDLTGGASRLLLSPDGALNLIPFEALIDEQGKYLIERFTISYLTSGRDLLHMPVARESKGVPLIVADPLFGEPEVAQIARAGSLRQSALNGKRPNITAGRDLSSVYFAPLAGSAQEAREIKDLFPEAELLTGTRATETVLKQSAAPRFLHLATHGFFLQDESFAPETSTARHTTGMENPLLRSGLALAGANLRTGAGDDGILTALEASGLNLWGTKLVVLSACDTGLGEVRNGEGIYGLRRAFVLAGAETTVMSLWAVSDYVTREIMVAYYQGLKKGEERGEALRQVKLAMLGRKGREHPFYWASFIQSGEWASLGGQR